MAAPAESTDAGQGPTEPQNSLHRRDTAPISDPRALSLEKLQATFDECYNPLTKPVEHAETKVLLFSWDKSDMDVTSEIARLKGVFEDEYGFDVREEVLDTTRRNPHTQLKLALAQFAHEIDGPNLGIVYYAGHGFGSDTRGHLHLTNGSSQQARGDQERQYNQVAWHIAESCITDIEADILVIFDCCSAGSLQGRSPRDNCFEFLGACDHDEVTAFPGEDSFTSALIHALQKLKSNHGFTSQELRRELVNAPKFCDKNQRPVLFHRRLPKEDHVWISASRVPGEGRTGASPPITPRASFPRERQMEYLDMRFRFGKELNEDQVKQFAKGLTHFTRSQERTLAIENITLINHTVLIRDILKRWRSNTGSRATQLNADIGSYGDNEQVEEPQQIDDGVVDLNISQNPQRLRLDVRDLLEQIGQVPTFSPRRPYVMALMGFVAGTICFRALSTAR